ncbi:lytic transglycosylase domain-containing protein [Candidatus Berkelbacteria bacterium]|nr:lytic transglycosylase domain-containing protein [Candidatus Berkelbacteria bacterium]
MFLLAKGREKQKATKVFLVGVLIFELVLGNFAQAQEAKMPLVSTLVLDPQSSSVIVNLSPRRELTITVIESRAEQTARLARMEAVRKQKPQVVTRVELKVQETDVGFETKRALAQKAAAAYGLDWKIVEAVWQVESGKRWVTSVRSYAGAQGPMQFMPGTWRRYGVDGNGDGAKDINHAEDAVFAGANYLAANGAASNIDRALLAYNHAQWYVDKVKKLAASIEG